MIRMVECKISESNYNKVTIWRIPPQKKEEFLAIALLSLWYEEGLRMRQMDGHKDVSPDCLTPDSCCLAMTADRKSISSSSSGREDTPAEKERLRWRVFKRETETSVCVWVCFLHM